MAKNFGKEERRILNLFKPGKRFIYKEKQYEVSIVGKPICEKGEPKTDIYISAKNENSKIIEIKISFKKGNSEFLENKISAERAEQLLGSEWQQIISTSTRCLRESFFNKKLIYKKSFGNTKKGSITLGWKFELLNKKSGKLSGEINLNRRQVIDVYAGTNLSTEKKNSCVDGTVIPNSGIANHILFQDIPVSDMQSAVNSLETIEEYVNLNPQLYFACKALNYRSYTQKYDTNRPLAVYVDWSVLNGKLNAKLNFNTPLSQGGNYAYNRLIQSMNQLNIQNTDDLNSKNVINPNIIY